MSLHFYPVNPYEVKCEDYIVKINGQEVILDTSMWDLPRRGMEPMSPALARRFFTTEPSGKPSTVHISVVCFLETLTNLVLSFFCIL